jgi:hypothetical protein
MQEIHLAQVGFRNSSPAAVVAGELQRPCVLAGSVGSINASRRPGQKIRKVRLPEVGQISRCKKLVDVGEVDFGVRPPAAPAIAVAPQVDGIAEALPPGISLVGTRRFELEERLLRRLMASDPLLDEWTEHAQQEP